jgi:hypothetical protein
VPYWIVWKFCATPRAIDAHPDRERKAGSLARA